MAGDDKMISGLNPCAVRFFLQRFVNVPHEFSGKVLCCLNLGGNMFLSLLKVTEKIVHLSHFGGEERQMSACTGY